MAQIANLAWSYAKLGFRHRPLFQALAAASIRNINQISMQAIAKTSWAMENSQMGDALRRFLHPAVDIYSALSSAELENVDGAVELEGGLSTIDLANSISYANF